MCSIWQNDASCWTNSLSVAHFKLLQCLRITTTTSHFTFVALTSNQISTPHDTDMLAVSVVRVLRPRGRAKHARTPCRSSVALASTGMAADCAKGCCTTKEGHCQYWRGLPRYHPRVVRPNHLLVSRSPFTLTCAAAWCCCCEIPCSIGMDCWPKLLPSCEY